MNEIFKPKTPFFYACSITSDGKTPDVLFCGFKQCVAVQQCNRATSGCSCTKNWEIFSIKNMLEMLRTEFIFDFKTKHKHFNPNYIVIDVKSTLQVSHLVSECILCNTILYIILKSPVPHRCIISSTCYCCDLTHRRFFFGRQIPGEIILCPQITTDEKKRKERICSLCLPHLLLTWFSFSDGVETCGASNVTVQLLEQGECVWTTVELKIS